MLKRWNFLKTGFYEGIKIQSLARSTVMDTVETSLALAGGVPGGIQGREGLGQSTEGISGSPRRQSGPQGLSQVPAIPLLQ